MLRSSAPPWPLLEVAIEPKSRSDHAALVAGLVKFVAEDPSVSMTTDGDAGQLILMGNDARHLDATIESLRRGFGMAITIGTLRVAYRETITQTTEIEHTHKASIDGRAAFARVALCVRPTRTEEPSVFESRVASGSVPEVFIHAITSGVGSVMAAGPLAGLPVIGVAVELLDAIYHEGDSSVRAFETASREALRSSLHKGGPVLLEPVMAVTIETPRPFSDAVLRDLTLRRGEVTAREVCGDDVVIRAVVPLATLLGLMDRSSPHRGEGPTVTAVYDHYAQVPEERPWEPPPALASALRA